MVDVSAVRDVNVRVSIIGGIVSVNDDDDDVRTSARQNDVLSKERIVVGGW